MSRRPAAILLVSCPDRQGLVATVSGFISRHGGNIIDLEQYVDREAGVFFMRVEWELDGFALDAGTLPHAVAELAGPLDMEWRLYFSDQRPRMAVLVSRHPHCLLDILARVQAGEWEVELPLVISNHPDLEPFVAPLGIPFHVLPVTPDTRRAQEQRMQALLEENGVEFLVLARYMQILTDAFVARWPGRIINIHHSFLPAFPGARPYHSAHARGVKIIGATSHYVTAELDAGPIIEQDVVRVTHNDSVEDLVRKGRDLEKLVLARAVWKHLQRKILVHGNRTVVFE